MEMCAITNDFDRTRDDERIMREDVMSEMITKQIKGRTGNLISISTTENPLPLHTSCAFRILLPCSLSKSSFCFAFS